MWQRTTGFTVLSWLIDDEPRRQVIIFRVIGSSSARIKERLTDGDVIVVEVFQVFLLGHGLLGVLFMSFRWAHYLWRFFFSGGVPAPQRKCVWLSSTISRKKQREERKRKTQREERKGKKQREKGKHRERNILLKLLVYPAIFVVRSVWATGRIFDGSTWLAAVGRPTGWVQILRAPRPKAETWPVASAIVRGPPNTGGGRWRRVPQSGGVLQLAGSRCGCLVSRQRWKCWEGQIPEKSGHSGKFWSKLDFQHRNSLSADKSRLQSLSRGQQTGSQFWRKNVPLRELATSGPPPASHSRFGCPSL